MLDNFSLIFKKYTVPFLFLVIGLLLVYTGITTNQGLVYMFASGAVVLAGLLIIVFSSGSLRSKTIAMIGAVSGILGVVTLAYSYKEVKDTNEYMAKYKYVKSLAIQNLQDVRYVQKTYAEKNGKYISNWDDFVDFVKNGKVPYVESSGSVPNRKITVEERAYLYGDNRPIDKDMTEEEAYRLSLWKEGPNWSKDFANFRRDTLEVSLMKLKFQNPSYVENRKKKGFYPFNPDSLPVIPYTKTKWDLKTKDSVKVGDIVFPTLRIEGYIPFAKIPGENNDREFIYLGDLSTNSLAGSWEE